MPRKAFIPACLLAVIILAISRLHAQTEQPAAQSDTILKARTTLVLVPALVRTKSGEPVFTLDAQSFTVTDDGIPQTVKLEQDTDSQPLALLILVQTGGAGGRRLDQYRNLGPLLDAVIGSVPHHVAVAAFDTTPKLIQDFTPDLDVANRALGSLNPGDGGAAILDGLQFAVDLLSDQPTQYRRAILLISETVDRGSHIKLDEALRILNDKNTAIYSLAFSSTKADIKHAEGDNSTLFGLRNPDPGPPGGCMAKDPTKANDPNYSRWSQTFGCLAILAPPLRLAQAAYIAAVDGLRRNTPETVSQLTGGEYFSFKDERSIEHGLATLSNHIPNRYVLSFRPDDPHPGIHALQLQLKDYPNLVVTSRSSYWVDSNPETNPAAPK